MLESYSSKTGNSGEHGSFALVTVRGRKNFSFTKMLQRYDPTSVL